MINLRFFWFILITFYFSGFAIDPSHYEAAKNLMETVQKIKGSKFIDTVINQLMANEPGLKKHKDEIYDLIQTYLNSYDYRETRIKAIMYFFTEAEIVQIMNKLKNHSFTNSRKEQVALVKRYQKIFKRLEVKFLEYIQRKFHSKIDK